MMNPKMQIQTFNQKLIDENVEINIIDYVKLLNNESYHIDISFIDDFVELVCDDKCCIHHNMLEKIECPNCKEKVIKGNYNRHMNSKICALKTEIYNLKLI